MQTDLQLLLVIFGLVLSGFILYNVLKQKSTKKQSTFEEFDNKYHDPLLEEYDEATNEQKIELLAPAEIMKAPIPILTEEPMRPKEIKAPKVNPEFIAISILPKQNTVFSGAMLIAALKANHFYYGLHKIFHRHVEENPDMPVLFSIASIVEPGSFEYHQMFNRSFPGILLWMKLPSSIPPMQCFDKMLKSARQFAAFLNGDLYDSKRNVLSTELIAELREKVHNIQLATEKYQYELEDMR